MDVLDPVYNIKLNGVLHLAWVILSRAVSTIVARCYSFFTRKISTVLDDLALECNKPWKKWLLKRLHYIRDQIKSLRLIQEQQGIVQLRGDADVIAIEVTLGFGCIQCISIREGQVIASQRFFPSVPLMRYRQMSNL